MKIRIFIAITIVLSSFLVYEFNKRYSILEKIIALGEDSGNLELIVDTEAGLDIKKLIISQKRNGVIFKNGRNEKDYLSYYGWSCFNVQYDSKDVCEVCYFKKNNWHVNNHKFEIKKDTNSIICSLKLIGPDSCLDMYYKIKNGESVLYLDRDRTIYNVEFSN